MVIPDPTEEIKSIRHQMGADFNFDLDSIVEDIKRRQVESGQKYIILPPRKINVAPSEPGKLFFSRGESASAAG